MKAEEKAGELERVMEERVASRTEQLTQENNQLKIKVFDLTQEVDRLSSQSAPPNTSASADPDAPDLRARLSELESRLSDKEKENAELLSYCDMLMAQADGAK